MESWQEGRHRGCLPRHSARLDGVPTALPGVAAENKAYFVRNSRQRRCVIVHPACVPAASAHSPRTTATCAAFFPSYLHPFLLHAARVPVKVTHEIDTHIRGTVTGYCAAPSTRAGNASAGTRNRTWRVQRSAASFLQAGFAQGLVSHPLHFQLNRRNDGARRQSGAQRQSADRRFSGVVGCAAVRAPRLADRCQEEPIAKVSETIFHSCARAARPWIRGSPALCGRSVAV